MSDADEKRERVRARIAASQGRLTRESDTLPTLPTRHAPDDAGPPEDLRSLAGEYPWLVVAAGAGAGLLLGAVLPKRAGAKLGGRALGLAAAGAEVALALSRSARDAAEEGARDGLHRLDERTAPIRRRAGEVAGSAKRSARSTGVRVASEAIKLAARLRK
ncbi:MAG TPA: hypothetical protein PK680_09095 [Novosphingobium sp.]|nr:hypothetical protein [Novosphingobium sp.]HQA18524.1 hypothetical protein [Novosphingobium sp.]